MEYAKVKKLDDEITSVEKTENVFSPETAEKVIKGVPRVDDRVE